MAVLAARQDIPVRPETLLWQQQRRMELLILQWQWRRQTLQLPVRIPQHCSTMVIRISQKHR
jgi:D-alanyl-D-alanine carboxypeptidase